MDRNGPKWTFVDTETDFLGTETDFSGYRNGPERTETDRNGPKRTFVDIETDFLGTETDFYGYRNGLFGYKIVIRVLKMTEIQNIDTHFSANQCR